MAKSNSAAGKNGKKTNPSVTKETVDWHSFFSNFLSAFWPQDDPTTPFTIYKEVQLGSRPLAVDFILIKKDPLVQIKDSIGRFFREYQVLEYKEPGDALNMDTISKGVTYAGNYAHANHLSLYEGKIGITFFRSEYPRDLFAYIDQIGLHYTRTANGVYKLPDFGFPIQVVVMQEISNRHWGFLRMLTNNLKKADVEFFENSAKGLSDKNKKAAQDLARQCVDANPKFVADIGGLEGVENMFSEYVQTKVDTAVSAAVDAAVDATKQAEAEKQIRKSLNLILDIARLSNLSFDDALAESSLADEDKEQVRNLYLSQTQ